LGIVAGAVKRPVESIFPAEAVHVTVDCPVSVNCCVAPSATCAVAGETVMGPLFPEVNGTTKVLENSVPGFFALNDTLPTAPWYPVAVNFVDETNVVLS
jgi:hypothetical protein